MGKIRKTEINKKGPEKRVTEKQDLKLIQVLFYIMNSVPQEEKNPALLIKAMAEPVKAFII